MPRIGQTRALPTFGWDCTGVRDSKMDGELAACELCGTAIRWVHQIEYEQSYTLSVGCCCAARLCFDYDADGAEREARNQAARFERFADRSKWRTSRRNKNNIWRFVQTADHGKVTVTIFNRDGDFAVYAAAGKGEKYCDDMTFDTQAKAIRRAFELLDGL